jgi:hypothetical protein
MSAFISYCRKDGKDLAGRLYRDLMLQGFAVFLDSVSIDSGREWDKAIESALNDASVVLAILTNGSKLFGPDCF